LPLDVVDFAVAFALGDIFHITDEDSKMDLEEIVKRILLKKISSI
jgi:hypothetical protein